MPPLLRVRNWDTLYENSRSREIEHLKWFPVPNDLSADSYVELVAHEDGSAHLGVWIALLMVASRASPRGTLVRAGGLPHNVESLALVTRLPEPVIKVAIERLLGIGLLEIGGNKPRKTSKLGSHPDAVKSQVGAAGPQAVATEQKGIEHHHQEGKRTEKKRTRTEPKGTERAREERTTGRSRASPAAADSSQKGDDADENPGVAYASPEDELKAIYLGKAGEPITIALLDAIRLNLEMKGVSPSDFVAEVRKHAANEWRNPAGFLRDLSKRFRAKTRAATGPVTAAEDDARKYQCPICHSRTPGVGAVLIDGKSVPCSCASPEYITRQRERGVFAAEVHQ
jgi:hypothetical protein